MPETPMSAMSGSSIFSVGAVFDRPLPFQISRNGGHHVHIQPTDSHPDPATATGVVPSPQSVKANSDVGSRDQGHCQAEVGESVNISTTTQPEPSIAAATTQAVATSLESWRQRGHEEWVEALRTGLDGQTLGPDLYAPLSVGGHSRSSSVVSTVPHP